MRRSFAVFAAVALVSIAPAAHAQAAAKPDFTKADVEFMHDMIHHHAQALEMCELAHSNKASALIVTMCARIDVSQKDEIEAMSNWLRKRHQEVPQAQGHHHSAAEALEHSGMPGMASPVQMRELAAAQGAAFDKLLLQSMIRHHEGAITMVKALFQTKGSGQESELFSFATSVDTDQRAEIDRMQKLLATLTPAK